MPTWVLIKSTFQVSEMNFLCPEGEKSPKTLQPAREGAEPRVGRELRLELVDGVGRGRRRRRVRVAAEEHAAAREEVSHPTQRIPVLKRRKKMWLGGCSFLGSKLTALVRTPTELGAAYVILSVWRSAVACLAQRFVNNFTKVPKKHLSKTLYTSKEMPRANVRNCTSCVTTSMDGIDVSTPSVLYRDAVISIAVM